MEGSVMKMRPLGGVDLPANQPVTPKPGGMHMCLRRRALQAGNRPDQISKAGQKQVEVTVENRRGGTGGCRHGYAVPAKR
jgi:copper(I)-binding protein